MTQEELNSIDPRLIRLIRAIGTETLTRRGIMGNMNLRGRRSLWNHYMTPAMEQGYIVFLYPKYPSSPDQAYKLTPKGMEVFNALQSGL